MLLNFQRCIEEREDRLEKLKAKVETSMANAKPVKKTILAYVDTVSKPSRGVARIQVSEITDCRFD